MKALFKKPMGPEVRSRILRRIEDAGAKGYPLGWLKSDFGYYRPEDFREEIERLRRGGIIEVRTVPHRLPRKLSAKVCFAVEEGGPR